eukprot:g38845.t1
MKFATILHLLHDHGNITVMTNGSATGLFPIQTSVKQGCVIAPALVSIHLAALLHLTVVKCAAGMERTYRTCGKLFNLCPLQAKTKVTPTSVIELWPKQLLEIQHRFQCSHAAISCLRKSAFEDNNIRSDTKIMVYRAVVVTALLCISDTWTVYS